MPQANSLPGGEGEFSHRNPQGLSSLSASGLSSHEIGALRVVVAAIDKLAERDPDAKLLRLWLRDELHQASSRVALLDALVAVHKEGGNPVWVVELAFFVTELQGPRLPLQAEVLIAAALALSAIDQKIAPKVSETLAEWASRQSATPFAALVCGELERMARAGSSNSELFKESVRPFLNAAAAALAWTPEPGEVHFLKRLLDHRKTCGGPATSLEVMESFSRLRNEVSKLERSADRVSALRFYRDAVLGTSAGAISPLNLLLIEKLSPFAHAMGGEQKSFWRELQGLASDEIRRLPKESQSKAVTSLSSALGDLAAASLTQRQSENVLALLQPGGARRGSTEASLRFERFAQTLAGLGRCAVLAQKLDSSRGGGEFSEFLSGELSEAVKVGKEAASYRLAGLGAILEGSPSPLILEVWRKTCALPFVAKEPDHSLANVLVRTVLDLSDSGAPPHLVRTFVTAIDAGGLVSRESAVAALQYLAGHAVAYRLQGIVDKKSVDEAIDAFALYCGVPALELRQSDSSLNAYRAEQIRRYPPLEYLYQQDSDHQHAGAEAAFLSFGRARTSANDSKKSFNAVEALIPPAQRAYAAWRRLADVAHGYGALLVAARKTPDGESPSLMRFGEDLGTVRFINARGVETFPGRGFGISGLDTERIFSPDRSGRSLQGGQFHLYKRAWPGYASEIDDLANTDFVFTRGMLIISCRNLAGYNLDLNGPSEPHSLVILNAHFSNPDVELGYLVKTNALRRLVAPAAVGTNDYRGFDPLKPDLNQTIATVKQLRELLTAKGALVDVGSPLKIAHGVVGDEHADWRDYRRRVAEHNEKTKDFDERFRKGRERLAPFSEERELHVAAENLNQEAERLTRAKFDEQKPWDLVHRYLNLFDLFRISHSYWNRGFTAPRVDDREQETELLLDENDAELNPQGSRMLAELYRWHSQREMGVTDRSKFYVAVVPEALSSSATPPTDVWIDSFDMTVHIGEQVVQLTQGAMTIEDQIFWQTQILPRARDEAGKIRDIRLMARESLGLK